jgi:hypothetical protein
MRVPSPPEAQTLQDLHEYLPLDARQEGNHGTDGRKSKHSFACARCPANALTLAPATSALVSTLAPAAPVHRLQQATASGYSHVSFSISELWTNQKPPPHCRPSLSPAKTLSPTRHPPPACLSPPSRPGHAPVQARAGRYRPLSPGGGSSARRVALAHLQPRSRLLLGAIVLTIGCIGTSLTGKMEE